jgi:hypothetical protein
MYMCVVCGLYWGSKECCGFCMGENNNVLLFGHCVNVLRLGCGHSDHIHLFGVCIIDEILNSQEGCMK